MPPGPSISLPLRAIIALGLGAPDFCDSVINTASESSSHDGTRWYAEEDHVLTWSMTSAYCIKGEIDCSENLRAWPCHL
jgi:hypothetical protein